METIISRIIFEDGGRILVFFNDGTGIEFPSMQDLISYCGLVLNAESFKRMVLATLLVNNEFVPTEIPKKYKLNMIGEPVLTKEDI